MATPPGKISVVIIDDHRMFREQLGHLIEKTGDMIVSGEADNIRDGLALIDGKRPSIAIVDISLKGSSGLELLKDLRGGAIEVPVLVLSMHDESLYAERVLHAGARGYLTKYEASGEVIVAIRQILRGDIYLSPNFMSQLASRMMSGSDKIAVQPINRLADRELEVFELIGHGLSGREIGEKLGLAIATVDTYKTRIKDKLNLDNMSRLRSEAARWVQERESPASGSD